LKSKQKLSEVIQVNPSRQLDKGDLAPFVAMEDITPYEKRISKFSQRKYSGSNKKFKNGDTLLAKITPSLENGKTAFVDIFKENEIGHGSTEFIVLCGKENQTLDHFVYYLMRTPEFREKAIKSMTGTSGRQRVQESIFEDYEITLPSLQIQEKISSMLKDLDEKIDNLQNQNKNLEQMTHAIFKSWFIDFDGVKEFQDSELGQIPKGWSVKSFGEVFVIADYTSNGSFAGLKENVTYSYIPDYAILVRQVDFNNNWNGDYVYVDKHSYDFLKKSFLKPNDIMISNIGANYGTVFIVPDLGQPMTGAPNVLIVKTEDVNKEFAYSYLLCETGQNVIESIVTGSAVPKFNKTDFKNHRLIYPNNKSLCNFHESVFPIMQLIAKNERQIKLLQRSRDLILPKLMSGEIRV